MQKSVKTLPSLSKISSGVVAVFLVFLFRKVYEHLFLRKKLYFFKPGPVATTVFVSNEAEATCRFSIKVNGFCTPDDICDSGIEALTFEEENGSKLTLDDWAQFVISKHGACEMNECLHFQQVLHESDGAISIKASRNGGCCLTRPGECHAAVLKATQALETEGNVGIIHKWCMQHLELELNQFCLRNLFPDVGHPVTATFSLWGSSQVMIDAKEGDGVMSTDNLMMLVNRLAIEFVHSVHCI